MAITNEERRHLLRLVDDYVTAAVKHERVAASRDALDRVLPARAEMQHRRRAFHQYVMDMEPPADPRDESQRRGPHGRQ